MEEIKSMDMETHEWLMEIPACHLSIYAFDEQAKIDHVEYDRII